MRTLFEPDELERVVDLQQKSYRLLQWVSAGLHRGAFSLDTTLGPLQLAEAAADWLSRNRDSFPPEVRPDMSEIDVFSHLFASYLATSFTVTGGSLKVRHLDRREQQKASEKARQMKLLYVSSVAAETVGPLPYADVETLLTDPILAEDIAWATYGRELMRRSEFASQGEAILVLWREIAWDSRGRLKKGFTLSATRILQAEQAILDRLDELCAYKLAI